jgi:lipopolysaccharide assembly outer membrane protein LptD (OstA)
MALAGAVVGVAVPTSLSRAQSTPKAAPKAAAKPSAEDRVGPVRIRNHPQGRATVDLNSGVRHMTREVRLWQEGEDFILYADDLTHYEDTNTARAKGNLRVESRDSTLIGDNLVGDFNSKMLTMTGRVVMKSHGESDGIQPTNGGKRTVRGEVLHKPSSLTCDRLDYDYETRQATLTGNIRMRQGENFGTCERIVFDEARNIAYLRGSVRFTNGEKQTIVTPELTIWIDENMIEAPRTTITIPNKRRRNAAPRKGQEFKTAPKISEDLIRRPTVSPIAPPAPLDDRSPDTDGPAPPGVAAKSNVVEAPASTSGASEGGASTSVPEKSGEKAEAAG